MNEQVGVEIVELKTLNVICDAPWCYMPIRLGEKCMRITTPDREVTYVHKWCWEETTEREV